VDCASVQVEKSSIAGLLRGKCTSEQIEGVMNSAARNGNIIATLFGTRPEVIKLAPIIREMEKRSDVFHVVNISSSQHNGLLFPALQALQLRVDHQLQVMQENQTPDEVCSRVLGKLSPLLAEIEPDLLIVQGDTTTAMAGALAGFHRRVPVAHVEAGLRSGHPFSPFPEEMNRRLISRLATYHFAATPNNRNTLIAEGIPEDKIYVTGNPVIDSLKQVLSTMIPSAVISELKTKTHGLKRIVLTTHRRESFGRVMKENLGVLREFVEQHDDVALIFPVHSNPAVVESAKRQLSAHPRIYLISPLVYPDFIALLAHAWLVISDSGGVQEEVPTLGRPLLILRENTERPEVLESGIARLVGSDPNRFKELLEEAYQDHSWVHRVGKVINPFGQGDSAKRIVEILEGICAKSTAQLVAQEK
jgi:UDP-N-acetylglucosamine 2-epimerase (non-hydrolysing)